MFSRTLTCVLCVPCRPTLQIPDMLGVVLSSSKYGVRQARGKYGMGAKMALIWSKKSTGLPIQVCACVLRVVGRLNARQAALASIKLGPASLFRFVAVRPAMWHDVHGSFSFAVVSTRTWENRSRKSSLNIGGIELFHATLVDRTVVVVSCIAVCGPDSVGYSGCAVYLLL